MTIPERVCEDDIPHCVLTILRKPFRCNPLGILWKHSRKPDNPKENRGRRNHLETLPGTRQPKQNRGRRQTQTLHLRKSFSPRGRSLRTRGAAIPWGTFGSTPGNQTTQTQTPHLRNLSALRTESPHTGDGGIRLRGARVSAGLRSPRHGDGGLPPPTQSRRPWTDPPIRRTPEDGARHPQGLLH